MWWCRASPRRKRCCIPELKFYSNRVKMDEKLHTNIQNFYSLGDSSGWTRGLMMASAMGVLMGQQLFERERRGETA